MRQDYKGAVKEFQRSIGLAPNAANSVDAASYMADAYKALDDTKGAIKAYKTALRLNPYRDDINIKLGNLYFSEKRYPEATSEYEKAVKSEPECSKHFRPRAGPHEYRKIFRCRQTVQQGVENGTSRTER